MNNNPWLKLIIPSYASVNCAICTESPIRQSLLCLCMGLHVWTLNWTLNERKCIAEAHISSSKYSTVMEVEWRIGDCYNIRLVSRGEMGRNTQKGKLAKKPFISKLTKESGNRYGVQNKRNKSKSQGKALQILHNLNSQLIIQNR